MRPVLERLLFHSPNHVEKIRELFGSAIVGYYPMGEAVGANAYDFGAGQYTGAYTSVTLGQKGIGDGQSCPLFDGATSYVTLPAGFRTAFSGPAGTLLISKQISSAVLADGTLDRLFIIQVDANNAVAIYKNTPANSFAARYLANAVLKEISFSSSLIAFETIGITWDIAAGANGEVKVFLNGVQQGATLTALGVWAGVPGTALIGATNITPTQVANGLLGHGLCLNRAASLQEMLQAAVV